MKKYIIAVLLLVGTAGTAYASGSGGSLLSFEMMAKTTNFLILLFLLHKFAKKPIVKMLVSAAEKVKDSFDASKLELQEAEEKLVEYKTKIANLEKELEEKHLSALKSIEEEKKQIIEDARRKAEKIEKQAEYTIKQNLLKAKAEIREFMIDKSVQLAEETVAKQIGSKEQKALIKNYTQFLEKKAS